MSGDQHVYGKYVSAGLSIWYGYVSMYRDVYRYESLYSGWIGVFIPMW